MNGRVARVRAVMQSRELPYPDPELSADGVRLRGWRPDDVDALHRAFGDATVQRFSWPSLAPYTRGDARAFLDAPFKGARRDTVVHSLLATEA